MTLSPTKSIPRQTDPRLLRRVLGEFSTGVTVVTYRDSDGNTRGATMNSFTSVSMDPPLLLVSVSRKARAAEGLKDTAFTVNILSANQLDIALHFAGKPNEALVVPWHDVPGMPPRLLGTTAWLQCEPWQIYDGGDHLLVLGRVVHHDARTLEPLTFHRGEFRRLGLKMLQMPRTVTFDGRPACEWAQRLQNLHALAEGGVGPEPLDL
ncbi:p-hydroxyphenylacetate 3-hydroxylase, reductase component [Nocardia cerradoensis]|uniref:p-hydroxyphenylacetate 3-hydroxylase, reductase component n=1 Tax=Nocardia cerradoensis TaxID=85688 RepID=A0A231H464_9NOCA|nr:flavin reductase family protein [Nocardia cerradoensis]OXR43655.1 p-hydroxyphenylacetate 3-hydroxylase, reductase component [Nocardia cerradoensis]